MHSIDQCGLILHSWQPQPAQLLQLVSLCGGYIKTNFSFFLVLTLLLRLGGGEKPGVTGALERWEIDPQLIKNPGTSLGTGSFGTVFKAELHGKPVAVKKLSTQKFDEKTLVGMPSSKIM